MSAPAPLWLRHARLPRWTLGAATAPTTPETALHDLLLRILSRKFGGR